ncbi:DUF4912 domain-containing protein [Leptolyngbya sp. CCY15150]|uniref:DUF4912 domain-containing protein n=1 Tax=Leptolyngbya sp. CCY15150 TaxID=2767772 RepID=UPI0019509BD2|nr:DUF4912 domain-containing protein [Leptolyngbya sp. CCY15150]
MTQDFPPLEEMTLRQLRKLASRYGVSRYSRMRKDELLSSIRDKMKQAGVAGPTVVTSNSSHSLEAQEEVEAAKFDVGQTDRSVATLAVVDEGLEDLPSGYGESSIVLMPRDPQWAYAYWDVPNDQKEEMRRQGGIRLALRFYDVTALDMAVQRPHSLQQYECDELAREWYLPIPVSDRDYVAEIGYICADGRWLVLARSTPAHIPPVYPSDWIEDQFLSITWDEDLRGKTYANLVPPSRRMATAQSPIYDQIFDMAESVEAQRVAGSLFGSMQQVPEEALSSYVFPSGVGMWAAPTMSGAGMSGAGMAGAAGMSGVGMSGMGMAGAAGMSGMGMVGGMSGVGMVGGMSGAGMIGGMSGAGMIGGMSGAGMIGGMSGIGMMGGMSGIGMSGAGFSASAPPIRPRQFWLIADAELIVYGATEPDATVTIGGRPIKLNPDGTFRFQMSFQDGLIDYPIKAVAADGEQTRSIQMKFTRETPERNTNTKEDAVVEWLN